jgi:hypothetical protein
MRKFFIQTTLLIAVLGFGLLIGIHQAERGVQSLQGTSQTETDESASQGGAINQIDFKDSEIVVIENAFRTLDLEEKQALFQERYHANTLSHIGNRLGDFVYGFSRISVEWVVAQLDRVL